MGSAYDACTSVVVGRPGIWLCAGGVGDKLVRNGVMYCVLACWEGHLNVWVPRMSSAECGRLFSANFEKPEFNKNRVCPLFGGASQL